MEQSAGRQAGTATQRFMRWRAISILGLSLTWLPLTGGAGGAQPSQPTEYQIKAAFLFNFAKFVDWPPQAFAKRTDPIVLGVLGENPFGDDLARTIRDKTVDARPLEIREFRWPAQVTNCHILFISSSEKKRAAGDPGEPQRGQCPDRGGHGPFHRIRWHDQLLRGGDQNALPNQQGRRHQRGVENQFQVNEPGVASGRLTTLAAGSTRRQFPARAGAGAASGRRPGPNFIPLGWLQRRAPASRTDHFCRFLTSTGQILPGMDRYF